MREMHGIHGEPTPIIGAHQSHNQHAGNSVAMFRDKFWLSLALTLPVVFWSAGVRRWLGYRAPLFPGRNSSRPFSAQSFSCMAESSSFAVQCGSFQAVCRAR